MKLLQPIEESVVTISFEVETLKFPAKVGIKSGYKVRFFWILFFTLCCIRTHEWVQTFLFDLDGCKFGARSFYDPSHCKVHGKIQFTFNSTSKEFNFRVNDESVYLLHTLLDTSQPYVFVADLGKGTKLKNFLVQTSEESAFVCVKFSPAHLSMTSRFSQNGLLAIWQVAPLRHSATTATTFSVAKAMPIAQAVALVLCTTRLDAAIACKNSKRPHI